MSPEQEKKLREIIKLEQAIVALGCESNEGPYEPRPLNYRRYLLDVRTGEVEKCRRALRNAEITKADAELAVAETRTEIETKKRELASLRQELEGMP